MEKICLLQVEGEEFRISTLTIIWLLYQIIFGCCICFLNSSGRMTKNHCGNDENGFREIGIKIDNTYSSLVKKCGLRVVYKKDIEDLNGNVVQCSNNSIIPYEGLKESHNLWPMVNIVRSQVSTRNVVKN